MASPDDVLEFINALVSGGRTIEYAELQARRLYRDDGGQLVDEALSRLQELRASTRHLTDPIVIEGPDAVEPWYPGPQPGDVFWPAYKKSLLEEGFPPAAIDEQVDPSSSKIMSYLRPPGSPEIRVRGLVLGHVQSGKTTSFAALIAKAADVGYRIFIVLSGINLNCTCEYRADSVFEVARDGTSDGLTT